MALSSMISDKRLLIFDLDGTLADTSPQHARAFAAVLAPLGVACEYRGIAGMRTFEAMQKCLSIAGIDVPEEQVRALAEKKQAFVRKLIRDELKPMRGVDPFLRSLQGRFRLALCTSGSRGSATLALETLGYSGQFDPVVCAEDVVRAKPDPEGFLKVLRMTGTSAAEALVFEDSDAGLESARRAGIAAVDVRPPFRFDTALV
jgi:HAD superfamily hydrolase (TIGR01509 family)